MKKLVLQGTIVFIFILCVLQGFCLYRRMAASKDASMEEKVTYISSQLDSVMERKYEAIDAVAEDTAGLLSQGASMEDLTRYFYQRTDEWWLQTAGECMSVYCANGDWQIMKDFNPDENYNVKERLWYAGVVQAEGGIYVSSPYIDYRTGQYHYSVAKMVDDPLAVCMDYSLFGLQRMLDKATAGMTGQYMLVDRNGMIYAHSDMEYAGLSVKSVQGYYDAVQKVLSFDGRTIHQKINGTDFTIYSAQLQSGWYLILFTEDTLPVFFAAQKFTSIFAPTAVLAVLLIAFVTLALRYRMWKKEHKPADASGDEILMISVRQNRYLAILLLLFLSVSSFFISQSIISRVELERESMENSRESFSKIVSKWYGDVQDVLTYMDYYMKNTDKADVDFAAVSGFIESVLENSDIISNVYVYNPTWNTSIISALESEEIVGMEAAYSGAIGLQGDYCITFPYMGEKYSVYCVTISKAVYDRDGNFICVACVDCFLDKLINILSVVETEDGYAFLADSETNIINHPHAAYQMRADRVVRAADLPYARAFLNAQLGSMRDYDNVHRFCMVTADEETGFYIVVMRDQTAFRRELVRNIVIYLTVVMAGIFIMTVSMRALSKWQLTAVRRLNDAAVLANQSSQAKSDFLANMSHEIRTPMNAIVGMCEMILREADISGTVREYCHNIQNSGRSLLSIINDILDFSKIEAGKIELMEEEFNIASTLNDVINMAVARKMDKKLEILVHVDPDIPMGLVGDELRIRQIIINLVTNGIKYTNEGCVIITASQTKQDYGINLSVSVRDTGIGITEENLEKLFSSFAQVDTKRNRSVEGTGLGLAISKRLITQMGGFINVSSVYGEGSEFRFVIPLAVSNAEPFIKVKNPESIHVIGFFGQNKFDNAVIGAEYAAVVKEIRDRMHVDIKLLSSLEELKNMAGVGDYTHIYVGKEEYLAEQQFFNNLAKKTDVVVVQDRMDAVPLPADIKCLFKPFYLLSAAAIFNNENIMTNLGHSKAYVESFVAPKARILVVDDNAINLQVAEGLMRPYHMRVFTADGAKAAIEMLRGRDIDLVFMDHMMPEIDGVEATKMIREMGDDYYRNLPIIALTANAVSGARNLFLNAGMNDFIAKPIELSALDRALKTWLPQYLIEKASMSDQKGADPGQDMDLEEGTELFSMKKGVFYTGGNVENYYRVLTAYVDKGQEKLEQIRRLYEETAWKDYVIEVHALKSASLSIGSQKLSKAAEELEKAGKAGDYETIRQKNGALLELYQNVLEIGRERLEQRQIEAPEACAGKLSEITEEAIADYRQRFLEAADRFDADEIISICEELSAYSFGGVPLEERFREARAAAEDFECETAGEEARRVFAGLLGER